MDADGDGIGGTTTTRFGYDGWNPAKPGPIGTENWDIWADLDGSNNVQTRYLRGDVVDQVFARYDAVGAVPAWLLTDRMGSVRDVLNNGSVVKDTIVYDGFGNITSETDSTWRGRYAWTGRELDTETNLQYNRARYYDGATGRWISQDPLGFDAGDSNLYRYVLNNPNETSDPSGLIEFFYQVPTKDQLERIKENGDGVVSFDFRINVIWKREFSPKLNVHLLGAVRKTAFGITADGIVQVPDGEVGKAKETYKTDKTATILPLPGTKQWVYGVETPRYTLKPKAKEKYLFYIMTAEYHHGLSAPGADLSKVINNATVSAAEARLLVKRMAQSNNRDGFDPEFFFTYLYINNDLDAAKIKKLTDKMPVKERFDLILKKAEQTGEFKLGETSAEIFFFQGNLWGSPNNPIGGTSRLVVIPFGKKKLPPPDAPPPGPPVPIPAPPAPFPLPPTGPPVQAPGLPFPKPPKPPSKLPGTRLPFWSIG